MVLLRNDEKRRDQKQLLSALLLRFETTRRVIMLVKIDPLLAKALANMHTTRNKIT